ncbi:hypothetical protein [Burkholderia pseudomallei]|uniref:hypothetical protein n=1 Tax=Burkholderia pseudomallei TaxID=28450 RepID=UPI0005DE7F43|nr:hypothetical protein [Burkholderia pseudomallei]CAJ3268094.1 Uncharacterised protein [Burkholderia pseudomallei]CAJ3509589.1 Uncharacterised protein [Burkholderia pseudomallei]CAJ3831371.1 Uncharacterised protein [Burkholderia pseudomallei]CAJ5636037.1 Uncharacterised protein [Burkholderia pseudomallei]CAJ6831269.1 Uncharacterised protein [Burkholderia pseudomallei]
MKLQHIVEAEESLRDAIRSSDVPFLGLMKDSLRPTTTVSIELLTLANPDAEMYAGYLSRYPALFSVHLTACIMEGMGQTGHFELYSHIQRAIGTDAPLSQVQRDVLWRAFRRAIIELGFEPSPIVSGPHFMANEYLRQAGVPLAYADDLAERMLTFARRLGLPDGDDPEAVISWQRALEDRLNPPFSTTAKKAVSLDAKGYYTQVFLRVRARHGDISGDGLSNPVERAMARAFDMQGNRSDFRRASLPYISLNEGVAGIFVPGGDEREFEFRIDGEAVRHLSGIEDTFVPFNMPLAHEIVIQERTGTQSYRYQLWLDDKANRILLFTDTGRFKCSGQLQANDTSPIVVPPGSYTCLSRFEPSRIKAEELWDDPYVCAFSISVHPGSTTTLRHGPAALTIQGASQPYSQWSGVSKATNEGIDVYWGRLGFDVEFPSEWPNFAAGGYVLTLSASGSSEQLRIPFTVDASSRANIAVAEALEQHGWAPGFLRLLAEVSRAGENRTLVRSSVNYWWGLSEIAPNMHFKCDRLPRNLQLALNENVRVEGNVLKPRDTISKTLRLVFQLDERRYQVLSWNVPGIFIEVETAQESGSVVRQVRAVGEMESVSAISSKHFLVSASEPGTLSVGDWEIHVDFTKYPSKRLPASLLASRLTPQSSSLTFRSDRTGFDVELLRLVQPHFVTGMAARVVEGQYLVEFSMQEDVQAVAVRARDVISGRDLELTLEANTGVWTGHRFGRSRLTSLPAKGGKYTVSVFFDLEQWPSGAWIFRFGAKVGGMWGQLENQRQDVFAAGFICDDRAQSIRSDELLACLSGLTDIESLAVLSRVQEAMSTCYMRECWESLQWIAGIWRALLSRWKGRTVEAVTTLVDVACARPPEGASSSWLLQQTAGAIMPEMYALPAVAYSRVNKRAHRVAEALRAISDLKAQYPRVFPDLIHVAAASAFSNLPEMQRGVVPRGFKLGSYVDALRQMGGGIEDSFKLEDASFRPANGDWLGPVHFRFAIRALESAYENSLAGNEIRRGQAMGLCRFAKQKFPMFPPNYHKCLAGRSPVVAPWPAEDVEGIPEEVAQRRDNLEQVTHLLSLLAFHCRLDARSDGRLATFMDVLGSAGIPVEPCLTYLLQIGEAVFAYYMLLWELVQKTENIQE